MRSATRSKGRARRVLDEATPGRRVPAVINTITVISDDTIQLAFATNVMPTRLPGFTAASGTASVTGMTQISATEIELVFDLDVENTTLVVAENDPGIRTSAGGFVPAGNYTIPPVA